MLKPNQKGFRSISLASCLMKIFEHLIKTRLEFYIESDFKISKHQFAFRQGKSCIDNITSLTTDIYNVFAENKEVATALLNIEGAYDNINSQVLAENFAELRIPYRIIKLITDLTSKRTRHFYWNERLIGSRTLTKELAQGSKLSPIANLARKEGTCIEYKTSINSAFRAYKTETEKEPEEELKGSFCRKGRKYGTLRNGRYY